MAVTVKYNKFGLIPIATTWFNSCEVVKKNNRSAIHFFRQSTKDLSCEGGVCINKSIFTTTVLDLSQSQDKLWQGCESKSCRYEIRKISKMVDQGERIVIKENQDIDNFVTVANGYIKAKKYSKPLKKWLLGYYIKNGMGTLLTVYFNNSLVGGNFYINDYPQRTRLLYSFNNRFSDESIIKLSGAFMRYLHWHAIIQIFKQRGYEIYDMGGVVLDKDSPIYGITKFKLSFGGTIREEVDSIFVSNSIVKFLYNCYRKLGS